VDITSEKPLKSLRGFSVEIGKKSSYTGGRVKGHEV
jgi:hypothetical protein